MQLDASTPVQQPGINSWPGRPAESGNGAFRTTFTIDWHELDLLRGPGSIQRTGPASFTFQLAAAAVAAGSEAGAQQEAEAVSYQFEKLEQQTVPVSFGGWVVKARLCC
ncbi:hypothetical protein OEZ85_006873 [Tetradesmus obliquus]|uniref:NADH:ubiquinone oxidoreductase intermediate-associated protein 30 domain-containing protein n=1 Tax=Tetradesmus obliquus TaxID=3088 RepID=A0ABY8TVX0_TETOB|nr:hypothetical protein OEZ85_006873 [Tetradesmus obliquus]